MTPTPGIKSQLIGKTKKLRDAAGAATVLKGISCNVSQNDLLPNLTIELRLISSLKPAKNRTRITTPKQLKNLVQSIEQHGFVGAILTKGSTVIDGSTRVEACKSLGLAQIPCIEVSHLSDEQTRRLGLAINRTGETGTWDLDALRIEIIELEAIDLDMSSIGFSLPELDLIKLDPTPEAAAEALDAVPALSKIVVTRLGDCWQIGEHKLVCGDARDNKVYQQLMPNEQADCVFSDAPYNCIIGGNVSGLGKVKHGEFTMASGEMSDPEFSNFLTDYLSCCKAICRDRAVIFACMNWRNYPRLVSSADAAGLNQIAMVVWDKGGGGGMGSPYRSAHELIAVFCNGQTPAINNVELGKHGRNRASVWHFPGANRPGSSPAKALHDHPTPKSVELVVNAILDFTKPGYVVLDPFMDSGTTIVACMESQRIARGIELDPKYADVAIRRWSILTGEQAVLQETGETYDEVANRRALEGTEQKI